MSVTLRPYPEYKDSGLPWLGGIPAHWEVLRSKYVLREIDVRSSTGEEVHLSMSQKLGLVPSADIEERRLVSESYVGAKLCEPGDIVLNRLKAHLGVFALVKQAGLVSPDYTVFRARRHVCPRYFEFVLRTPMCRVELRKRAKGVVEGFWRLYTDDFYEIALPSPRYEEQERIISFIDGFDSRIKRLIRAKRRLIDLLNEQKQVIIQRAVSRGIDPNVRLKPSGIDWLGDVPEHWEIRKLKFVALSVVGGSSPSSDRAECWDGDIVWVTPEDVSKVETLSGSARRITRAGLDSCSTVLVPPGSIVVTSRAPVGNVALGVVELCTNQGCKAVVPRRGVLEPEYGYFLLRALLPELQSLARGTTFAEISTFQLANVKVPLPPLGDQQAIVDAINSDSRPVDQAVDRANRVIDLLSEYRTRVIADVVTGKVDVRALAATLPEINTDEPLDDAVLDEGTGSKDDLDDAVEHAAMSFDE